MTKPTTTKAKKKTKPKKTARAASSKKKSSKKKTSKKQSSKKTSSKKTSSRKKSSKKKSAKKNAHATSTTKKKDATSARAAARKNARAASARAAAKSRGARARTLKIGAAGFSGDGRVLATSAGKRIILWDVSTPTMKRLSEVKTQVDASRIAVDREGKRVAAAVAGFSEVRIRSAAGALLHEVRARGAVTCFAFAPDGRFLLGEVERIGEEGLKARSYITLVDLESGAELFRSAIVDLPIRDIAFSSDGLLVFLGFGGGVVVVFDLEAKRELFRFPNVDGPDIGPRIAAAFSFSSDGRRAAISLGDVVEVWPVDGGDRLARIDLGARTWSVALDATGERVICGAPASGVWSLDGTRVMKLDVPHNVVATPDGRRALATDRVDLAKGPKLAATA